MSSTGVPLDTAAILSTVLEGILYGFSLMMFGGTVWALSYRRHKRDINRLMMAIAFLLLILSTIHIIVNIKRLVDGLVTYRDTFPKGPPAFFADVAQETFIFTNAVYSLQTLLGDGVVIYRCYAIWQSFWVILFQVMLWCSVAVTAVGSVYNVSQATTYSSDVFVEQTGQWITAFYVSTLATNLLSSGLLAYRIWTIDRHVGTLRATRNTAIPIVRVLVDSAILYSAALFTALVCFVCTNNGQFVVADMITPIISIAFYMVLIRVGISKNLRVYASTVRSGANSQPLQDSQRHPLRPIQVHISQFTERHKDGSAASRGTSDISKNAFNEVEVSAIALTPVLPRP
ncbi:hypothetical protein BJ138DRAFT_914059 [Hygrophoropsis aurantiaca]|uniref:Uncharacterized protein n=1 Tax=Hygrophoropsis aurantiaca TaxID=72124 RepID=A0ACB7ZTN3_9AGAM|nr:hypothetical protein BJ138DRAFT_914059 [Hygrophoropsis aurantiaca]